METYGLPAPEINGSVGPFEVDLVWREQKVAIELDGFDTHRTRAAFERDRSRDRALGAMGWRPARATWRQTRHETAQVAADTAAMLGLASLARR